MTNPYQPPRTMHDRHARLRIALRVITCLHACAGLLYFPAMAAVPIVLSAGMKIASLCGYSEIAAAILLLVPCTLLGFVLLWLTSALREFLDLHRLHVKWSLHFHDRDERKEPS